MKRNALFFGLLCAFTPMLLLAGAGPRIHFAEQEHDFGDVIRGQSPSVELPFSNTGDVDLIIERIASSCGCAKAIRGSRSVPPGSSSKVYAQIETSGMSAGKHIKTVAVHSNDPRHPVTALKLLFNVIRHVSIQPDTLATSVSQLEQEDVFPIEATNHWTEPVTLRAPLADESDAVVLLPREMVLQPGEKASFRLSVRIRHETPLPYLKGKVIIKTSDPVEKELPVRVLHPGYQERPNLKFGGAPSQGRPSLHRNFAPFVGIRPSLVTMQPFGPSTLSG